MRIALRLNVYVYRWRLGWLLGRRFLLLTHLGRRTGGPHHTVLEVVGRDDAGDQTVMSGGGPAGRLVPQHRTSAPGPHHRRRPHHPGHPPDDVRTPGHAGPGRHEQRNRLAGWLLRRTLSSLVGRHYDATSKAVIG